MEGTNGETSLCKDMKNEWMRNADANKLKNIWKDT